MANTVGFFSKHPIFTSNNTIDPKIYELSNIIRCGNFDKIIKYLHYVYLSIEDDELVTESYIHDMKKPNYYNMFNQHTCKVEINDNDINVRYNDITILNIRNQYILFYDGNKINSLIRKKNITDKIIRKIKISNILNE